MAGLEGEGVFVLLFSKNIISAIKKGLKYPPCKRVMRIQEDPYLETREKEDAFADRIVGKEERKVLSFLPALLGLYVKKDYEEE